ncbi:hypothetical protein [Hoeflea sp.]|uniref:hypothetical protein n=1 Tax=Hoeflea sp. TaxID=1940281 RepID=UPI003B528609
MDRTPKILVIASEPILAVDIMSELEARGFEVEPMKPGDCEGSRAPNDVDVAILDINGAGVPSVQFASDMLHSDIPVVMLGASKEMGRLGMKAHVVQKPVDYTSLASLLTTLSGHGHPAPDQHGGDQSEAFING